MVRWFQDEYVGDEFQGEEYVDEGGLPDDCFQPDQGYWEPGGFRRKKLFFSPCLYSPCFHSSCLVDPCLLYTDLSMFVHGPSLVSV